MFEEVLRNTVGTALFPTVTQDWIDVIFAVAVIIVSGLNFRLV